MKHLHPNAMRQTADYVRTQHHVDLSDSTDITLDDIMVPGFWRHHTERMRCGDLIDVIGQGFDITLRVKNKGLGFVNTYPLRIWTEQKEAAVEYAGDVPDGYSVDHTPRTRWRVRMTPEGTEISRDHMTKAEAVASAKDHSAKIHGVAA